MRRVRPILCAVAAAGVLPFGTLVAIASPGSAAASSSAQPGPLSANMAIAVGPDATLASSQSGCQLANGVQHVFYIGFDNFHLRRDNANSVANNGDENYNNDLNIPSDLEQVPALYNFLRGTANAGTTPNPSTANNANYADGRSKAYTDGTAFAGGTLLTNQHTPLISHTSVDFTTSYAGVYGDRHGVAVSQNNIAAYTGNASTPVASTSGFSYWTDPLGISGDATTTITTKDSSGNPINAPAPWVPYTRAGCDVGAVSTTGFVLENAKSATAASTPSVTLNTGDEGIAVHCAQGSSSICNLASTDPSVKSVPDNLPAEPGGYSGYQAIFGNEYAVPAINDRLTAATSGGSHDLSLLRAPDTFGYGSTASTTPSKNYAFAGFSAEDGNYTLGYTLAMQKAGVPITFGYLSDAHDCHNYTGIENDYGSTLSGGNCTYAGGAPSGYDSFGSGEAGYEAYLSQLNTDFQLFFDQAKASGYTTANTEFVFYSDENDHVSEATPVNGTGPSACDGVTVACAYNHNHTQLTPNTPGQFGEATIKLDNIAPSTSATSPYFVLADSAPDFYVKTPGSAAIPSQTATGTRSLERTLAGAQTTNPYTGASEKLFNYMADQNELNALHMVTADPQRTPTVTGFAPGQDYVESSPSDCGGTANNSCSNSAFGYVHGDFAPETNTTWAGFAGPGVANLGTSNVWTDHVDLRPTLLSLLGLQDDYTNDGRVISEILLPGAVPASVASPVATQLGTLLKQLDAPVYSSTEGANDGFGPATLVADTEALASNAAGDSTYTDVTGRINTITAERNVVTGDIKARLLAAESGSVIDPAAAATDVTNGQCVLAYANALKAYAASPSTATAPTDCNISGVGVNLPEVGHPALLVLIGGAAVAGGVLLVGRRRRLPIA